MSIIDRVGRPAYGALERAKKAAIAYRDRRALSDYLKSDRRPWRRGYDVYRREQIASAVRDDALLARFRESEPLPAGYGYRVDARIVEIPWVLARVARKEGTFLDAGSSLNQEYVLRAPALDRKKTTIVTLAPEGQCFWRLGVSYSFEDLRNLDLRDDWFDDVACISTIEHVGMDNTLYAAGDVARRRDPKDFLLAASELRRVLKPGGTLLITFPYGRYEDHRWFQQFDAALLDRLVEAFAPAESEETVYCYDPEGWRIGDREECADREFFDVHTSKYFDPTSAIEYPPDYPAGERAVACLALVK